MTAGREALLCRVRFPNGPSILTSESRGILFRALRRNLTGCPFYAAFCRTRNSVLVTAMR
jgi:hypothetical protein